ncbi:helix-turn-helix domain-containing protein [Anaerosinus sp.]
MAYYRKLRNLTQEELSEKINISKSSLGKIECGCYNNSVSLTLLMLIAEGLDIDIDLLVKFDVREKNLF